MTGLRDPLWTTSKSNRARTNPRSIPTSCTQRHKRQTRWPLRSKRMTRRQRGHTRRPTDRFVGRGRRVPHAPHVLRWATAIRFGVAPGHAGDRGVGSLISGAAMPWTKSLELQIGNWAGGDFESGSINCVRRTFPGRALGRTHRKLTGGNRHELGEGGLLAGKRQGDEDESDGEATQHSERIVTFP
jgi:hypothetical protein